MKRWDDLLGQYDRVKIRSLLGGRVKYGYPPFVKDVDVWLPAKASYLQDIDIIMSIRSASGVEWSLAARGVKQDEIHALPCGNRVLVGEWVVDIRLDRQVYASPFNLIRQFILNEVDASMIYSDWYQVVCFQKDGALWHRNGMFDAVMFSVELEGSKIICKGQVDWLKLTGDATIILDAKTGDVIGGDKEAMVVAGEMVPVGESLKKYNV